MKLVKELDVYLSEKKGRREIELVQSKTGYQLVFNIMDFEVPSGTIATLFALKPSKKFVYQTDGITVAGNTVTVDLENQAIAEHGNVYCQIELVNGTDTVSTFTIRIFVEASLADSSAEESKTVIGSFNELTTNKIAIISEKASAIAEQVIATIPDDYTTLEAKVNELANAIKGTLSGEIVVASDVSTVEHEMDVWVHGKNLLPYPYTNDTVTLNGGTFTAQADGGVAVSGTPTDYVSFALYSGKPLAKTGTVVFELSGDYTNVSTSVVIYDKNNLVLYNKESWKGGTPITVNLDDYPNATKWLVFIKRSLPDVEMTGVAYPQLELSDTPTDYEAWIEPTTVTVKRCGKNLFDVGEYEDYEVIGSGTTISDDVIKGEVISSNGGRCINLKHKLPSGQVGISFDYSDTMPRIIIRPFDSDGEVITECTELTSLGFQYNTSYNGFFANTNKSALTIPEYVAYWYLGFVFPITDTAPIGTIVTISHIQVEVGNEVTSYEIPNITEYIPTSDGTVAGMTSLSPNMTILTDTDGVVIECEYNVDTQKYVDEKAEHIYLTDTSTGKVYELKITDGHIYAEGVTS